MTSRQFRRERLKADKQKTNTERPNRMINTLNQSTELPRLSQTKFLPILGVSALVLTAALSRADSDGNQSERGLAGTWIAEDGTSLESFMSDGRQIGSIPINIPTHNGPGGGNELAAPEHGEWVRTGNREYVSTVFAYLSSPDSPTGFTHLFKGTGHFTLNKAEDELTEDNTMITIYFPDGTVQFGPFPGGVVHFKRVIAGQ